MKAARGFVVVLALGLWAGIAAAAEFEYDPEYGVVAYYGDGDLTTYDRIDVGTGPTDETGDGIVANDGWVGAFSIGWEITPGVTEPTTGLSLWKYEYAIRAGTAGTDDVDKALSHWILGVSSFIDDTNWQDYIFISEDTLAAYGADNIEFGDYGTGPSNPGLPGGETISGLKFNVPEALQDDEILFFTFYSTQQPVYGDFYAKDGTEDGLWAYAYNAGFGTAPPEPGTDPSDGDYLNWIATIDTEPGMIVPEPGLSVLALAAVVAGVIARRRKGKEDEEGS